MLKKTGGNAVAKIGKKIRRLIPFSKGMSESDGRETRNKMTSFEHEIGERPRGRLGISEEGNQSAGVEFDKEL